MSLFNNRRVEEDLEKIRRANTNPIDIEKEDIVKEEEKKNVKIRLKELTFKDYIAMVIAVFSIVIPYLLIFIGLLALFAYIFYLIYLR